MKRKPKATEIDAHIGAHLKRARLSKGWSQKKVAAEVGVSFQQIQKYEKGINRISASKLLLLAECFDIPISSFFCDVYAVNNKNGFSPKEADKEFWELFTLYQQISDVGLKKHFKALLSSTSAPDDGKK